MENRRRSSFLGGCLGGTLGGALGIGFGGWIAYTMISTEADLPPLINPAIPGLEWVTLPMYAIVLGGPTLLGACAGGIVGLLGGSMIGSVVFSKRQKHATPHDISNITDVKQNTEGRLTWVNSAVTGLVGFGLFGLLLAALTLFQGDNLNGGIVFMTWSLIGVVSGIMLSKRISGARVLGVIFVLPGLLVFPLGTVIALLLIYAMFSHETARYLSEEST